MYSIKKVLMERDEMTSDEADELINEAKEDLEDRLALGDMPFDICAEWFGLEPDYLDDLILQENIMKRGFKPYNKRKPFKRKTGGPKFMLGSNMAKI